MIQRRSERLLARAIASVLLAASTVIVLMAAPAASARASGFTMGISGDPALATGTLAARAPWISRAVAEGAQFVRLNVSWNGVAPKNRPAGFVATNPASHGYYWVPIDASVRSLSAAGLRLGINVTRAPKWAEAPGKPAGVLDGTWKPSVSELAKFATAIATRYSGHFPDPLRPGLFLPRVGYWQGWNEPNLSHYLTPQWVRTPKGFQPASPDMYRNMANAFYTSVKAVSKANVVLMAGTAPYGNPIGGLGMRPIYFYRHLFCLTIKLGPLPSCPGKIHFDIVDHHPYDVLQPTHAAIDPDDATIPDMWKVSRVVRAGVRFGQVLPRANKPLWATEFAWDSNPPDPRGISLTTQAAWLEQSFYLLWRQGVSTALWFLIRDEPPIPSYFYASSAGLYYLNGQPKPSAIAFRFPLVTSRPDHSHVFVWGRAPSAGTLMVERAGAGGSWRVAKRIRVHPNAVFTTTLKLRGRVKLRARVSRLTSLTWTQTG